MGRGGRAPCFHSWPWLLPSSSPTRLVAGSPPPLQEQVGSWCPVPRVTWPRLSPAPRPGQHSCGCDRRLGSDSPRHIPGPDTILFCFFFFLVTFSPTLPPSTPPFPQKCCLSLEGPFGRWLLEGNAAWISWNMRSWSPSAGRR